MTARLASSPIPSFRADGSLMDLAAPLACEINFAEIAARLSVIPRFAGSRIGTAYSDAQHCVMGAEALINEGADARTAALFLLHDAHEGLIGDIIEPTMHLIEASIREVDPKAAALYRRIVDMVKSSWDEAIYAAAGLPIPAVWTNSQKSMVKNMDKRMAGAEARALCGPRAIEAYPLDRYPTPKTKGAIKPWGAMKAEEAFVDCFKRLIGEDQFYGAAAANAAHRGTMEYRL
ncbi:hypothetical protein AM571_CH01402 [Rhizobium etli 8C-3]|uniref:Metal-dependent phosphohydrolase HD domain-containing protein n=1 Tax=Rhizobium etli 8C-3 TaxID=538025 RepID=A0A1L5P276_RHIET|nr:hypothetical protein [Rhizobium etli]APO74238.1 hypothetical protein AM571_CH01402 [Rhizobium etli 8C-3]